MIQLRPYQAEGLRLLWDYFASGQKGNPVLAWPTGTGKSVVPAIFTRYVLENWPSQKFLMVTHVKELIDQNAEVLLKHWPTAPLGIHSAGLKKRDVNQAVIYGGIQSMIKHAADFGHRDIIFIDEAHLVSLDDASMYLKFLAIMRALNPMVRIIGMSATPYRMGQGMITDPGGIFTDICHDLTSMSNFNQLIQDGYLAPLAPLRTKMQLDVSGVKISGGEFVMSNLQSAVDKAEVTLAGLREVVAAGQNRRSWLMFASGIEHAEHIAAMLQMMGVPCAAVHSKQPAEYNDRAIKAFKNGELRSIANFGKLTTGFNHPWIDLIGMFRPTLSVPLWVQMLGRGTRPASGKKDCLALDFAKNTFRLGPINDPIIPKKKGDAVGDAPVKICDSCGVYNHTRVRYCTYCGTEFEFEVKIFKASSPEELIKSDFPQFVEFDVARTSYQMKTGPKGDYIRVGYYVTGRTFNENVYPEGKGLARHTFNEWWKQRHPIEPPKSTSEASQYFQQLRAPARIRVHINAKPYPLIAGVEF